MPCAAHISSIASTYRTLRTTRRSFQAAAIAIGTTSSLFPPVGIVSTLAGCDSTLHSLASEAAVTCAIMKPELTPASRVRNAGSPWLRSGFTSRSIRRSEMVARLVSAMARKSSAMAMEVPAAQQLTILEHERVVRARVELTSDHARGEIDGIEHRPVHLRHASQ